MTDDLRAFIAAVRGARPELPRRVLCIAAEPGALAALEHEGFDVSTAPALVPGAWDARGFDGLWFGSFEADPLLCAETFRVLHHGWARIPVDDLNSAERWRAELLLERAGMRVRTAPAGLIAQTLLITPKIGAGALIFDQADRILLTERADGQGWCIPGGHADPDESPSRAAVREVREETGLEVALERLLGVYTLGSVGLGHRIVVFEFLATVTGGQPTVTDETLAIGWFPETALPEPLFANHRRRLVDGFAARRGELATPVLREEP